MVTKTGWMRRAVAPMAVEGCRHHLQFGRADVGAIGVAEEDQHVLAEEILLGDLAVPVDRSA